MPHLVMSAVPAFAAGDSHDTPSGSSRGHSEAGSGSNPNYHFWTDHEGGGTNLARGVHWSLVHADGTVAGTSKYVHDTSTGLDSHRLYRTGPHINHHNQGCS